MTCLHTLTSKMRWLGVSQTFPFTTPSRHPQLVCRAFRRVFTRCLSLSSPSHLFRIRGPPRLEQNRDEVNSGLRLALPILARRTRQLKNQHQHGVDLVPFISRLFPLAIADGRLGFGARTIRLSEIDFKDPIQWLLLAAFVKELVVHNVTLGFSGLCQQSLVKIASRTRSKRVSYCALNASGLKIYSHEPVYGLCSSFQHPAIGRITLSSSDSSRTRDSKPACLTSRLSYASSHRVE